MRADLAIFRVEVVALSKDNAQAAARHKARDNLSFTLLADPKLGVIRQFGVEHHKAVEFSGPSVTVLGITLGFIPSLKKMAIPTTLLVDEHGVIQWIDQADDYRLRSSESRVLQAVRTAFPNEKPVAAS